MKEQVFVKSGILEQDIYDFLEEQLKDANYEDIKIQYLPTSTRIIILTTRPGLIIGAGGENIERLTNLIKEKFKIDNIQIDVQRIENNVIAPKIIAKNIARGIENNKNHRRLAEYHIDKIMKNEGILGVEIILDGKLSGSKTKKDKFSRGYMKKAGELTERFVKKGYATALPKTGSIGIKVSVYIKPDSLNKS